MDVRFIDGLSEGARAWAEGARTMLASQRTLEDVVRWGLAMHPLRMIDRAVAQDEFTLDLVMRVRDDAVLVYDCT